jgi:NTP pyrophosphatase (non-canonical NTP hydrolase)
METKVTPDNYHYLAMRTAKLMDARAMLVHGALGLLTEVGELSEIIFEPKEDGYTLKELGDVCWFATYTSSAFLSPVLQFDLSRVCLDNYVGNLLNKDLDFPKLCNAMSVCAANIGSNVKAHAFYGKPLDVNSLHSDLQALVCLVGMVAVELGLEMSEILQANIDKLRQRYPNNFTEADALERKDETGGATPSYTNQDQGV